MNITNIALTSLNPIQLRVSTETPAEQSEQSVTKAFFTITQTAEGEAFIRVGESPVERYSLLQEDVEDDNSKIDPGVFWETFYTMADKKVTYKNKHGEADLGILFLGVVPTVCDFPSNPKTAVVRVTHHYRTRPVLPAQRKDLRQHFWASTNSSKNYSIAGLFNTMNIIGIVFDGQISIGAGLDTTVVDIRYKGTTDQRHLKVNERLASLLGNAVDNSDC